LSRLEHVPELDADQRALGCRKRFEIRHGTSDPVVAQQGFTRLTSVEEGHD
jgi:hypothetical protein